MAIRRKSSRSSRPVCACKAATSQRACGFPDAGVSSGRMAFRVLVATMGEAAVTIALDGVTKSYDGRNALDQVSLAVAAREFLAIVGPSGSGKTTLLRIINRLTEPSAGRVRVGG